MIDVSECRGFTSSWIFRLRQKFISMHLSIIFVVFLLSPVAHSIYKAQIKFSSTGGEFQPRHSIQSILNVTARSRTICSAACNQQPACRIFDYDSTSRRCRLFEADLATGSIIPSVSPTSIVGSVVVSPSQFIFKHNESCQTCQEDRYEYCSANDSRCQCRPHTFWDGIICSLQQFENDSCSQIDACRTDLNLTCSRSCNGTFLQCKPINIASSKLSRVRCLTL